MVEKKSPQIEKKIIKETMNSEKVYLVEIKPYSKNAKKHPESQIQKIMKSIVDLGYNDPIAIDEKNEIIEGHGRFESLKRLNDQGYDFERIQVIRLKGLTDPQKKSYRLAHNKLNMETGFDLEMLNEELESLETINFDTELTGFGDQEIGSIRDKILVSSHERNYSDKNKEMSIDEIEKGLDQECPKCHFKFPGK